MTNDPAPEATRAERTAMSTKRFELFMGCLGNGTTLCNKAVIADGDYKTIGHISNAGNIKLYVNPGYIPEKDMETIKKAAARSRVRFIDALEAEIKARPGDVYERMLDRLNNAEFIEHVRANIKGLSANIAALLPVYLERS